MKLFLTNATGYVGGAVAAALLARGDTVEALVRTAEKAEALQALGIKTVLGDLASFDTLTEAAKRSDGVVHTAFDYRGPSFEYAVQADRDAIAALVKGLMGSGKPLVTTSGTGILGNTGAVLAAEDFPADPTLQPIVVRALAERDTLLAAGQGVRSSVLRLPLYVYGHGGSAFVPMQLAATRQHGIAYYYGTGDQKVSAVHIDDAVDLYLRALESAPAGSLFNVSGQDGTTARAIAEALAHNVGVSKVQGVSVEEAASLELLSPWIVGMLAQNNQVTSVKAAALLGWQPQKGRDMLQDIREGSYKLGSNGVAL